MSREELVEGLDYYIEKGFMVFTAIYLQRRGYCCQSGCRHCPYGYKPTGGKADPAPTDADH
jgi:hypothetical protein